MLSNFFFVIGSTDQMERCHSPGGVGALFSHGTHCKQDKHGQLQKFHHLISGKLIVKDGIKLGTHDSLMVCVAIKGHDAVYRDFTTWASAGENRTMALS